MKNIALHIALVFGLFACVESDIVEKYNTAQVKTLLTDNDVKTWFQSSHVVDGVAQQSINDCQDTVRLVFEVIRTDSTSAYELKYDAKCELYDTTKLGQLQISTFEGIFTDSLNIVDSLKRTTFWQPTYLGPSTFSVSYIKGGKQVQKSYQKMRTGILARQVAVWLTGGSEANDSKTYLLTKRTSASKNVPLTSCADSLQVTFSRDNSGGILMHQLTPTEDCVSSTSEFFGEVSVPGESNEGFFTFKLFLVNGSITEIDITSITPNSFSGSFVIAGVKEVVTYVAEP